MGAWTTAQGAYNGPAPRVPFSCVLADSPKNPILGVWAILVARIVRGRPALIYDGPPLFRERPVARRHDIGLPAIRSRWHMALRQSAKAKVRHLVQQAARRRPSPRQAVALLLPSQHCVGSVCGKGSLVPMLPHKRARAHERFGGASELIQYRFTSRRGPGCRVRSVA